ncbi:MAG: sugar O-acetyltransferase [Luteolibacter sp.]
MAKTEKEKMLAGETYHPADAELQADRSVCRELCRKFNQSPPTDTSARREILNELFGAETDVWIEPPFYCDYGRNIHFGSNVFLNFDCVILDGARVEIGDNTFIAPAVQIYTAEHPLDFQQRRDGWETARPITIGSDVWIGGGAILCPGVTIGDRTVIGAGSVVTRSLPSDVVAAGNPARVIRNLKSGETV